MSYTAADLAARELEIVERCAKLVSPSLVQRLVLGGVDVSGWSAIDAARALYEWRAWARPKQVAPPGEWSIWLSLGGRGLGKTRTGAEWIRERVEAGIARSIAVVGPDWKDLRRYQVGSGNKLNGSGLLDVFPPWNRPTFYEQKAEIHWPNGAIAVLHSAENQEFRGAGLDTIWCDEPIKWKHAYTLWDNIEMTLREPGLVEPQACITTTPQPMKLLEDLIMDEGCVVTHGTTWENDSNLAKRWLKRMKDRYAGTRVGEQELGARLLGDNPDCLFHMPVIDAHRVADAPDFARVCVGVDPAVSTNRKSDETGIVAVGMLGGHIYPVADMSGRYSPEAWGRASVDLAVAHGADWFCVENNKIGNQAKYTIMNELKSRELVGEFEIREVYSMTDKAARATPVAALYEQGRVHHVGRRLGELEAEQTTWNPKTGKSPNRIDALVHAAYELLDLARDPGPEPADAFRGLREANRRFGPGGRDVRLV